MKAIILAGGLGTRISEETETKPKPMVLLDDKPIIWHLMNIYATQGYNDFIIATGYKGEVISNWVDSTLNQKWNVRAFDTGLNTMTAGRIKKCMDLVPSERVMVTYGDGLGNVNIKKLINFHEAKGKSATVTAVRPPARFGVLLNSIRSGDLALIYLSRLAGLGKNHWCSINFSHCLGLDVLQEASVNYGKVICYPSIS
jgi:glucose-1-phosphate cytidylyltransferase